MTRYKDISDAGWIVVTLVGLGGIVYIFKATKKYIEQKKWKPLALKSVFALYALITIFGPVTFTIALLLGGQIKFGFH